jgi:uncharacterized protein (DUF952 family)
MYNTMYKILSRPEWEAAQQSGQFVGSDVDMRDGYIHFSTAAQAQETARRHFPGKADLVVLEIPTDGFGADLKWEPSRGGELFPHLYAPLPVARVTKVFAAPLGPDNVPVLQFLAR